MRKIAIIGLGHVGSTLAYTLIERQLVDHLALFDTNEGVLQAEHNDLIDGQVGRAQSVRITINNIDDLANCQLCVFAAGDIAALKGEGGRFDELGFTKHAAKDWATKLKTANFNGILLNITNPCDVITRYLQVLTELPKHRVFGTGTSLDTARMKHATSRYVNVHPDAIEGVVLGEHGDTQFIPWSLVRIGFYHATHFLSAEDFIKIEEQAKDGGFKTFNGKGYTSYGIASQAAQIIQCLFNDGQMIFPLSIYHEEAQLYIGYPAKIGRDGISQTYPPVLTEKELKKWQESVAWIQKMYDSI